MISAYLFGPTSQNEDGELTDTKFQRLPITNGTVVFPDIPKMALLYSQLELVGDEPFVVQTFVNRTNGRSVINVTQPTIEDQLRGVDRKSYVLRIASLHPEVHEAIRNSPCTFAGGKTTWAEVPNIYSSKVVAIRKAIDLLKDARNAGASLDELDAGLAAIELAQASLGVEYVES